jgi:hypothetical protein
MYLGDPGVLGAHRAEGVLRIASSPLDMGQGLCAGGLLTGLSKREDGGKI